MIHAQAPVLGCLQAPHRRRHGLLCWVSAFQRLPARTFVRREPPASESFGELFRTRLGWEVSIPGRSETIASRP